MGLTIIKPENYLTSLTSAWNFNSVQHVCVNPNVSIYKCFKTHRFAQFQTPATKRKTYHSFPSTLFSFSPLSDIKRYTVDGSKGHNATNKATRLFSIRTALFTCWYHILDCRNVWLNDVRFLHQKSQIELCIFYCRHPEQRIHRWMFCTIIEHCQ
jgi:hypothetical protein